MPVSNPVRGVWRFRSYICGVGVSAAPAPQLREVRLSADHPLAECLATYYWVPSAQVELVKTAAGPDAARSGPAVVTVSCRDVDGGQLLADGQVVLDSRSSRATLPRPLLLPESAVCIVREPRNGAVSKPNWSARDGERQAARPTGKVQR